MVCVYEDEDLKVLTLRCVSRKTGVDDFAFQTPPGTGRSAVECVDPPPAAPTQDNGLARASRPHLEDLTALAYPHAPVIEAADSDIGA